MTTIHFIRHGEVYNPEKILYARMPGYYLSPAGHRQAHCTARILKLRPIVAVYSSPMPRAVQTADYVAHECGLQLHTSTLINEIHTPYAGWPLERMEALRWDLYTNIPAEFESWQALMTRVEEFCHAICDTYPGGEVVAATHGDVVISAALWAEGLPLEHAMRDRIPYPGHASITSLRFAPGNPRPQRTYDDPFINAAQDDSTTPPHSEQ